MWVMVDILSRCFSPCSQLSQLFSSVAQPYLFPSVNHPGAGLCLEHPCLRQAQLSPRWDDIVAWVRREQMRWRCWTDSPETMGTAPRWLF